MKVHTIRRIVTEVPDLHDDAIYYVVDLAALFRKSKITIARWVKAGLIPPPSAIGLRSKGWRGSVVREMLNRMAPSRAH